VKLYRDRSWLYEEHRVKGKSINQIAREQGVSWSTVWYHLRKNGIPIQKQLSKQYPSLEPSPELSYILGVIDGDGSMSSHNRIELEVKDKVFAEEFAHTLRIIGLRTNIRRDDYWSKGLKRQARMWKCYAISVVFVY